MFDALERVGVDLTDVFQVLEDEGVEKFEASWKELLDTVKGQLDARSEPTADADRSRVSALQRAPGLPFRPRVTVRCVRTIRPAREARD